MVSGQIAQGFITVTLQGFQAVQAQLARVRESIQQTAASARTIATSATSAFSQASAEALKFARVADPLGSLQLDLAFARLSVQIGRFFIPLLHQATELITRFTTFLASLSDETREAVSFWAKLGLAVTGVLAVGGKLAGAFGGAVAAFGQVASVAKGVGAVLWRILGFLGPWGRAAVIIGTVAAALFGLSQAGGDVEGMFKAVLDAGKSAWEALSSLWGKFSDMIGPAVAKAVAVAESLWTNFTSVMSSAWEQLTVRLGPSLEKLGGAVAKLAGVVGPLFQAFVDRLGRDFEKFGQFAGAVFERLAPLAGKSFDKFVAFAEKAITGITAALEAVQPHAERLAEWLTAVFESDQGKDFAAVFAAVADGIGRATEAASALADVVGEQFDAAAKRVGVLVAAVSDVWDRLTGDGSGVSQFLSELGKSFQAIAPYLEKIGTTAGKVFNDIKAAAGPVIAAIGDAFNAIVPVVSKLFDKLAELGGVIIRLGGALYDVFGAKLAEAVEAVRPHLEAFFEFLSDGFEAVYPVIKSVVDAIGKAFTSVINFITNAFYTAIEAITGVIQKVIDTLNGVIDGLNKVPGVKIDTVPAANAGLKKPEEVKPPELAELPKAKLPQPEAPKSLPKPEKPEVKKDEPKKTEDAGNKFVGQLLGNARFTGISDAFRAAQQATVPTRETAIMEEIARGQKAANAHLGKIADNTARTDRIELK